MSVPISCAPRVVLISSPAAAQRPAPCGSDGDLTLSSSARPASVIWQAAGETASELEVDERFLHDRHGRETERKQCSDPAPRERPGPSGRQRQAEASAAKRVVDPDDREDAALDREYPRARVRLQAEDCRKHLGGLGGAVTAEEHPGEHDPELGQYERGDMPAAAHLDRHRKPPYLAPQLVGAQPDAV